jgi:uncharacterized protein
MTLKIATPGVYVQEIMTLPPSVAEVESAIPAFVGYTKTSPSGLNNVPTKISSWADFNNYFCGNPSPDATPDTNGGPEEVETNVTVTATEVLIGTTVVNYNVTVNITAVSKNILWYAMKHFFANGGGNCYIVSVGTYAAPDAATLVLGVEALVDYDEPTMILCPEASLLTDASTVVTAMITQASNLRDRIALIDVVNLAKVDTDTKTTTINKDIAGFRGLTIPSEGGRYAASYYPNLETSYQYNFNFDEIMVGGAKIGTRKGSMLYNAVKAKYDLHHVVLPPSAAIAGMITRVDNTHGYWKAPANTTLNNVVKPTIILSDNQQGDLNIDPMAGKSINVIRQFPGQGTVVWGARTLEGNSNEWRYVNVRRFFMVVEESIKKSINWAVFEPNTAQTWVLVQSMIENYLFLKWRDGALAGTKPEDAYFVRVGINKTMTPQDILEGKMIVEIGMAVARPAEFIVLKFMQLMQKS